MNRPRWVETFHDLHVASSVEELWGVLLSWHGIGSTTQWVEAYELFRKFHADDPTDAVVTAALLCTDYRWRRASHHLIARLTESGVLDDSDEQQLAEWFVSPDGLAVDIEVGDANDTGSAGERADRVVAKRPVWPPLRRWAAACLIAHEPDRWRSLLDVSDALASRDGAALAAGVMDAAGHIPLPERSDVLEAGLCSGSGIVRIAALPRSRSTPGPPRRWRVRPPIRRATFVRGPRGRPSSENRKERSRTSPLRGRATAGPMARGACSDASRSPPAFR